MQFPSWKPHDLDKGKKWKILTNKKKKNFFFSDFPQFAQPVIVGEFSVNGTKIIISIK